jgi:hypothetical protein
MVDTFEKLSAATGFSPVNTAKPAYILAITMEITILL